MDTTRREFLKVKHDRGSGCHGLRLRPHPRLRPVPRSENLPHHRDPLHVPLLLGELRRHHPHPRRQGQERHARRWSTSKAIPIIPSTAARSVPKARRSQQDIVNDRRLTKPQVRRPGSDHWEDISWDTAIDEIAAASRRPAMKPSSRRTPQGRTVNRCEGIAWNGGCTDTNEFNYLVVKTMRSLGVCYLENQARV